jgi:hypothetical protein
MGDFQMVPLIRVGSSFEAKVLAARLGSEGILYELRGNVDGMYPFGDVTVLVPAAEWTDAANLLDNVADGRGDDDLDDSPDTSSDPYGNDDIDVHDATLRSWTARPLWRTAALLALAALTLVAARSFFFQAGLLQQGS